jgi:hypothetical protein
MKKNAPWKIDSMNQSEIWETDSLGNDVLVAEHLNSIDAAHIVRCVNEREGLLQALKDLTEAIPLGKLNIRKDFHLLNVHACATKALYQAEQGGDDV